MYMTVIIIVGTLLVLCMGFFNRRIESEGRNTLLLNLLFFGFGTIAIAELIIMYYSHLEHIRMKKNYLTTLNSVKALL